MSYSELPHLRSNVAGVGAALAPSVAAGSGAGAGATAAVAGTDQYGVISITTAGTPAAGTLATLTFATPYANSVPTVSVSAGDAHTAVAGLYATSTGTAVTISYAGTAPAAAQSLKVNYHVIGGA